MPAAPPEATAHRRPRHRVLKWLGLALGGLVALIVLGVGGVFLFASTHYGAEKLRGFLIPRVNAGIEGHLSVGALSLHGGHLVLQDVVLDDPRGHEVARIARVDARVSLFQLTHKTLDLTHVQIERPVLHIVQDANGTNLQRAIASRHPTPKQPSNGKSSFTIDLEDLRLRGGVVDFVQATATPERHVHLEDLAARGSARLGGDRLSASLRMDGAMTAPTQGPLRLALNANGAGASKRANVSLVLAGAKLVALADLPDAQHANVRIESLVVPPELASSLVPTYPLQVPLAARGFLRENGKVASLDLTATAGKGELSVTGSYDLISHHSDGLHLRARHMDLAQLTPNGPPSDLALDVDAAGGGTRADDAVGQLSLLVPPSRIDGERMGPIRLNATADHGLVTLRELTAQLPGVSLAAQGTASRKDVHLSGKLTAENLDAFSKTLGRLGKKPLSLSGNGQLTFAANGSTRDPSLRVDGRFPALRYADKRLSDLTLHADVPQVKHPDSAQVALRVGTLVVDPKHRFRGVQLRAVGHGSELALNAQVHGFAELSLALTTRLDRDDKGGELRSLTLRYPEATWTLARPVRIAARGRLLHVGPLELRSGAQRIALRANKRGNAVDAELGLHAFDLSRLPKAFVPPSLRLAGRLDVSAKVAGSTRSPDVVAKVDLQRGHFKKYANLGMHLDASYLRGRARGQLQAHGAGVNVASRFDVPVKALKTGGPEPVRIDAELAQLDLGPWLRTLDIRKPIQGLASARITVRGTASDPKLDAVASLQRFRLRRAPPADLQLTARSEASGKLSARADLSLEGKKSELAVQTPFTVGELIRHPLKKAALMNAPLGLDAELRALPLSYLSEAGLSRTALQGTLTGHGHLRGTPRALDGTLSLAANGVGKQGAVPLDGALKLSLGTQLRASLFVAQKDTVLVDADATLHATTGALQDRTALAAAPLAINARVGPLQLAEAQKLIQPKVVDPTHQQPPLAGVLQGSLQGSGSLNAPRLSLNLSVNGLQVAHQKETGDITLSFVYAQAKEALQLALRSQDGGRIELAANTAVDLSLPKLRQKTDLAHTPISASLLAERFNPAFLSHLSTTVDRLGGEIDGNGKLWGTVGSPRGAGRLEWKNGLVETGSYGDFRDLHLLAEASNDHFQLTDLSMKSGDGHAKMTGWAQRQGNRFHVHAVANLDKFPAMSQGELMATISLNATADGTASASRLFIRTLDIPEAHVQLPDVKKKDLQKLGPAQDVVLTIDGKPVKGQKVATVLVSPAAPLGMGVGGSGSNEEAPVSAAPTFQAVIRVNAPRNLWIQGNDIDTEVGLSDNFRVEYASAPMLFGDVNLLRGRLEVFGRRFDWQKSSKITFTGPVLEPELAVTAVYKNETEGVTVYLKATGQGDNVQLTPTSDPPLSETEIYTLLATGHLTLRHGSGNSSPAGTAASLVGSFAAGQLKKTLQSVLPLDVFSIEAGDNGLQGTKVEAGTYVNDRLYLGFTGRVGADPMKGENADEVDLEYQLSKRWSLQGSYGNAQAGGADLVWRKDY